MTLLNRRLFRGASAVCTCGLATGHQAFAAAAAPKIAITPKLSQFRNGDVQLQTISPRRQPRPTPGPSTPPTGQ
jgi:hypothetical protein